MIKIINKYGAIILINETVFKQVKMNSGILGLKVKLGC